MGEYIDKIRPDNGADEWVALSFVERVKGYMRHGKEVKGYTRNGSSPGHNSVAKGAYRSMSEEADATGYREPEGIFANLEGGKGKVVVNPVVINKMMKQGARALTDKELQHVIDTTHWNEPGDEHGEKAMIEQARRKAQWSKDRAAGRKRSSFYPPGSKPDVWRD